MKNIHLLFGMEQRVSRKAYALWGLFLMLIKYLGEVGLYYLAWDEFLTPLNFLSPVLGYRYPKLQLLPDWFPPAIILWSLPFIWVGVSMSIRRCADAGKSPWWGILFFVPGLNYLLLAVLAALPTSTKAQWEPQNLRTKSTKVMSPFKVTLLFAVLGAILAWFSTNFLKTYAVALFIGSPLILGLVQGYFISFKFPNNVTKTIGFVLLTIFLIHLLLLLFALEGIICLAMSLPLSFALGIMGALLGAGISYYRKPNPYAPTVILLALPLMPWIESYSIEPHQDMVLTSVEIEVPPEKVWPNVVKFSELPPSTDWLFQLGVAYPKRARIEGEGVGAVRYCEFSTGAFVEPITVWEEPERLAFDVKFQPEPLKEVSFYDQVDAPHLDGYFRSIRGEFRLKRNPGGKTLLEGRTWYEVDMHPGWYWQLYGRWFIHKIHKRVLDHVKNLSEANNS